MRRIIMLILPLLFLTGCAKDAEHIYVQSYETPAYKVYYDEDGNTYKTVSENQLELQLNSQYINRPVMKYYKVTKDYTLYSDYPGHYLITYTDAYAYVTNLLNNGYSVVDYKYTPTMCTLILKGAGQYKLYIEDTESRIYYINEKGEADTPPETRIL